MAGRMDMADRKRRTHMAVFVVFLAVDTDSNKDNHRNKVIVSHPLNHYIQAAPVPQC
ncbi:MAG TPA: hypothetical protein VEY51_16920 [Chondromyces sp.]|nr:hypothetical protein [Chondromyces sp.]